MKTTLELPDNLLRLVKATAARGGESMRDFVIDALRTKLKAMKARGNGWRAAFGAVDRRLTDQVDAVVAEEFSRVDPRDWE